MITDGNVRDVSKIIQLGFAAFSRSARPIDYRGRMKLVETQQPVELGGVTIHPGDIICADDDGAVVVPSKLEAQVLEAARARAAAESTVLSELLAGATLREVWTRHGIL
jgi:regulator of RNase E activity RraA